MPKIRIYTVSSDNGDGSASCMFFKSEAEQAAYVKTYDEESYDIQINPDNISYEDINTEDFEVVG